MAPVFRYDFNSPYSYLASERVDGLIGHDIVWQPIALAFLLAAQGRTPWSFGGPSRAAGMAECDRRAAERALPPLRWLDGWPRETYSLDPLRVAMVAAERGLLRQYSHAAFRRMWVDGVALGGEAALDVAGEVGLARDEVRAGMAGPAKDALRAATDEAIAAGVPGVPTVTVGAEHFWGDDRLEDAVHAAGPADRPRD